MHTLTKLPQAMLFDLDGTLADTIPQLAKAAKSSVAAIGLQAPDIQTIQSYVGNGVNLLLARVILNKFDVTTDDIDKTTFAKARAVFNDEYMKGLSENYRLYDGVVDGLKYFKSRGIKLAVVTNKPQVFAVPLLKFMGIYDYFDYVLGGEVLAQRKPSPEPLEHCLEKLNVGKDNAIMVGDSDNDIIAGNNAKLCTVFFTYGYNRKNVKELDIDYSFDSFSELTNLIQTIEG